MICCFQYFIYRVQSSSHSPNTFRHEHFCPSVCLSVCLSICLSVCLPVCFSTMNSPKPMRFAYLCNSYNAIICHQHCWVHDPRSFVDKSTVCTMFKNAICSDNDFKRKHNLGVCILLVMIAIRRARCSCGLYVDFQWLICGLPVANMSTTTG